MTSISSTSSSWQYSPSQLLQQQLQQDVSSGQISSTDQTALTSALDQIQSSLQDSSSSSTTQTSSSTQATSTTPPSAADLQSKISSLIDNQVSAGTLTSSQATELKGVFQQTFGANDATGTTSADSTGAVQGHHGGHGGHHHGVSSASEVDATDDTDTDTDTDTTSATTATAETSTSSSSSSSTTGDSAQQLVDQFLQALQAAQSTGYGAAGTSTSGNLSSFLVNVTV